MWKPATFDYAKVKQGLRELERCLRQRLRKNKTDKQLQIALDIISEILEACYRNGDYRMRKATCLMTLVSQH